MAVERMMPNVGGPRQSKRRLIMSVVSSLILYAAPIWADALSVKSTAQKLISVYRLCGLRVSSAYRTTSEEAVCILAGMIPIDILADESKRIYDIKKGEHYVVQVHNVEREESIRKWQARWEESRKGRWTFRLIPNIKKWINRKHGEVNYHLTQFLSGHGGYRSYLFRFGLDDSPICPFCPNIAETPEHVMFHCPRFTGDRQRTEQVVGKILSTHNIIDILLTNKENWEAVCSMIKCIHVKLKEEEESRKTLRNLIMAD